MRITVLMGGTSAERDVSLASGLRIAQALRSLGHSVLALDPSRGVISDAEERAMLAAGVLKPAPPSLESLQRIGGSSLVPLLGSLSAIQEADVVFLALHGGEGEDGTMQALLDMARVRYTGSGHLGSALAMDKDLSKQLFEAAGVPTARWMMARDGRSASAAEIVERLGLPLIVKPSKQGSTVGLSVVRSEAEIDGAVTEAWRYDDEVMLEQFIPGRELTVSVVGDEAFPVGEIFPVHEIYDYECKYTAGMAREEFPAQLTAETTAAAQGYALEAFRALKLDGYARIDFRMTDAGHLYCLEANTLPGMTELSLLPQAAAARGMDFAALCDRIVQLALASDRTRAS
jgi:D-alanine-D-alanine ligase